METILLMFVNKEVFRFHLFYSGHPQISAQSSAKHFARNFHRLPAYKLTDVTCTAE